MPDLNQPLGTYISHARAKEGLDIEADNARVEIRVHAETTVRLRIARPGAEAPFSYAVVGRPQACRFSVQEGGDEIVLKTKRLHLRVALRPLRFSFHTPAGDLINADDPAFGTSWLGDTVSTYKSLQPGERFVGLGEKTGGLDRAGSAYTNWNTDYFAYPTDGDPLYASFPFYIGAHAGLAYGIFMDNSHKSAFNFGASNDRFAYFSAEGGDMDYYFIHAPDVAGILRAYTDLTGRMPMPPLWSLGYQQCRYSYYPESEVLSLARTFRDKRIPADVLYFDIHYMQDYKVFTWDRDRFPDPKGMLARLKDAGFRGVVIVDPGVKAEKGYAPYEEGLERGLFVKYPDGQPYRGEVWPGWCHFPDFTDPAARRWWADSFEGYVGDGLDGFWNDMNEPATWGQHMPDLIEFDLEGRRASHREARNVYGMQMARATLDGARRHMGGRRPFVLTRAAFCGIQRYAAVWTGDNVASDDHMLAGVRLVNSLGLAGVPFGGYDIGGFAGEADPALFARWISIGALAPFARGHSMINTRAAEPWSFGEEVEAVARNYLKLRYGLLPYLYSAFYRAHLDGLPVARSLCIDYTHDPRVYDAAFHNQYLLGDSLLVCPVPSGDAVSKVYLPAGEWRDLYTGRLERGGRQLYVDTPMHRLPVFVRAGAIVPMQEAGLHTGEAVSPVLTLHLYPGKGELLYYEDDGESYDYEKGRYYRRTIRLAARSLTLEAVEGRAASRFKKVKLCFHGFKALNKLRVGGGPQTVRNETARFCDTIESFDPFDKDDADPYGEAPVQTATLPLRRKALHITW